MRSLVVILLVDRFPVRNPAGSMCVTTVRTVCPGEISPRGSTASIGLMTTPRLLLLCKNNGNAEETVVGAALLATHTGGK